MNKTVVYPNIILGSGSPRRKELLSALGFSFEVIISNIEEIIPTGMAAGEAAGYLAKIKNEDLQKSIDSSKLLITADTVVIDQNDVLGKPKDADDAFNMLTRLSNKEHEVVTGVHLSHNGKQRNFSVTTMVTFEQISDKEIHHYINNYEAMDRAGAYGIQDWIGHAKVSSIIGSYTNVMGLPTADVYREINQFL